MGSEEWEREFGRIGLGYRLEYPELATTFELTHLKRHGDELHGDLTVLSRFPGASGIDGVIFTGRFNVMSTMVRGTVAKALAARVPQQKEDSQLDWAGFLLDLCYRVIAAERQGEPIVELGTSPRADPVLPLLDPLLPKNKPTILFGDGGVGKSVLALAVGASVAIGQSIIPGMTAYGQGAVLYLDYETDAADLDDRLRRVSRGAEVPMPRIQYRYCARPLPDMLEDLSKVVVDRSISLLIIDSAAAAMGIGSEYRDPADTAIRFFTALRTLGVSSLLIDHVSKTATAQAGGAGKPYGSTYKVNLARSTWEMRQGTRREDGAVPVALYHRKSNIGPTHSAVGLAITFTTEAVYFDSEPITDTDLAAALPLHDRVALFLDQSDEPLDAVTIAEAIGSTRGAVASVFNRDKRSGNPKFISPERGKWTLA